MTGEPEVAQRIRVRAVDADDGKSLWSYTAGGRVDTPPTVYGQLAVFGSADGWVYCLNAADGSLVASRGNLLQGRVVIENCNPRPISRQGAAPSAR